ncbi:MAG: hypothetical protein ACK2U2_10340 [Anaerolineae bacterium]|jgi:hypothetical protein
MRQISPYRTVQWAARALDNGGRFYNLFTRAGDNVVEGVELARAAGVYSSDAMAFLYFEMALMDLPGEGKAEVLSLLAPDLRDQLEAKRPRVLLPSCVESKGRTGLPAIVTGYPYFVEDKSQFRGFVVTVTPLITLVPIMDEFDVYELFDTPDRSYPRTLLATVRGSRRLDGSRIRFGGVLKELRFEDKTGRQHGLYLEAAYYTPLQGPDAAGGVPAP